MLVDAHCHLELEDYDGDRGKVIDRAAAAGVSCMVTVGTEVRYFEKVVSIIEKDDRIYGAVGVHPHNAKDYSPEVEKTIKGYLGHPRVIAYGEIGLDFYRNHSPAPLQVDAFRRQIALAREAGLPVIIHSRNAKRETLDIVSDALRGHTTVIHCYSYDVETAGKLLDMGIYLSIPGTITYPNNGLGKVVRYAPLDRLLSETDAPFLPPTPERGKRNEPAFVGRVVAEIAALKSKTVEETAAVIMGTFRSVFLSGLKDRAHTGEG
jgi:TatD DNase family protein